jgi:hypothetical protein
MAEVNLTIQTNATFDRLFVWTNTDGSRRSLAGYKAQMQVRKAPGKALLLNLTSAGGAIRLEQDDHQNSVVGVFRVVIPAALTANILSTGPFPYDLRIWADNSLQEPAYRLLEGLVTFDVGVSINE